MQLVLPLLLVLSLRRLSKVRPLSDSWNVNSTSMWNCVIKIYGSYSWSRSKGDATMLKLIEGSRASSFPQEMDAMFRNRALTFSERLGWDVTVKDGYERDEFDDANPLYLVSVDPNTNEYWGSLRLLPTTGPNMLRDVFPCLLEEGEFIESATIWEGSRICCVSVDGQPQRRRNGVNFVLSELIAGIGEVAVIAGLTQIVSVFDARIYRVLKAVGCNPQLKM